MTLVGRRARKTSESLASADEIVALDCLPIELKEPEDREWLRGLVASVRAPELLLSLGGQRADDAEPIASFDGVSGVWRAGRYIGEVRFEGRTLRIEPRFGLPSLLRWLGTIWDVRLTDSGGATRQAGIWLWYVIAHLWAARFIVAAKHGLPYRRVDRVHYGRALRGRLLVRESALALAVGDDRSLASLARERVIDPLIGPILLTAHRHLSGVLGVYAQRHHWLPERTRELLADLRAACGAVRVDIGEIGRNKVRYSPITENYRSLVDLSLSIIARRPHAPMSSGSGTGVLLDMAEVWELYVARLLQVGLPSFRVIHSGRTAEHFQWLAQSGEDRFGSFRPDVLIKNIEQRCVAVADAKYKGTRIGGDNRTGILTADLYQMNAYLSGFGDAGRRLDGFLIYPEDLDGQIARRLGPRNPWQVSSARRRNLWFVSADCSDEISSEATGQRLTGIVRNAIGNG